MTISYPDSFGSALLRWKGSLWKAVIWDILLFYVMYYILFFYQAALLVDNVPRNATVYSRFCSDGPPNLKRQHFAILIGHFERGTYYIPITFLLGFFVSGVLARWWEQFNWISWPDKLMIVVNLCIGEPRHLGLRRTVARWANLQAALAWRLICVRTKARFPTVKHLVEARLMSQEEHDKFEAIDAHYGKWFVPTIWISNLFRKLHKSGEIDTLQLQMLTEQLMSYRDGFAMLYVYDWVHTPLVYTHVVSLATFGYFTMCIVARQPNIQTFCEMIAHDDCDWLFYIISWISNFIPIFTTLQMAFFNGWLKVGQYLMSPFGDDDDDFELNWILDRNQHTAYLLGDELCSHDMDTDYDPFNKMQVALPHTRASLQFVDIPPRDNLRKYLVNEEDMQVVDPDDVVNYRPRQNWVDVIGFIQKQRAAPRNDDDPANTEMGTMDRFSESQKKRDYQFEQVANADEPKEAKR